MSISAENIARQVLEYLSTLGVREAVLCPGRRNAPFVFLLENEKQFITHSFFEERSAGFFGMGRIKREGKPVAIITTSGTACAELLPAVIEAYYSGLPLVLVTADRPRRLRGSGAPQTIDQVGLFGSYVEECLDVESAADIPSHAPSLRKPLHINVCFDEPLGGKRSEPLAALPRASFSPQALQGDMRRVSAFWEGAAQPLVCCGPLPAALRDKAVEFLSRLQCPLFLESTSNLRGDARLEDYELRGGNNLTAQLLSQGTFDRVLRIGGVPATRFWRDLDERFHEVKILSVSERPFTGCERGALEQLSYKELFEYSLKPAPYSPAVLQDVFEKDRKCEKKREELLSRYLFSEPGLIKTLSTQLPRGTRLYLGNSLPIREWDLAASYGTLPGAVEANRGANGIDGQLSTFFGWCAPGAVNWGIFGDLTALYDLSSPWILREMRDTKVLIIVINNGGGQIFSRMFESHLFLNEHAQRFKEWAAMWKLPYACWEEGAPHMSMPESGILEVIPSSAQTDLFWKQYSS